MKKSFIFVLIIAIVALLCACNLDAQDGIYSAIASSTKESSTKIQSYLGYHDSCYYILTDTSITRIGTGTNDFTDIPATGDIIEEAALLSDGSILVRRYNEGKIYKYSADGKTSEVLTSSVGSLNGRRLLTNGKIVADYEVTDGSTTVTKTGLFNSDGTAINRDIKNFKTVLESGDYTLIETYSDTTTSAMIYIYKDSTTPVVSGKVGTSSSSKTVGFEAISDTEFYVLKANNEVYKISADNFESLTEYVEINYTLASGNTYSFHYSVTESASTTNYLVFKASENFVVINLSDKTTSIMSSGYGTLKQNVVVNILPDKKDTSKFIVATFSNSLWRIDPTTTNDPENLL
jgi:hypothetical protein